VATIAAMPAITRTELLKQGVPRSTIDRRIVSGLLLPVHVGVFACDATWESQLAAHLLRGGPLSAASHRAAARLHGFDGFTNPIDPSAAAASLPDLDITVPKGSTFRAAPAVRSTSLDEGDVVRIGSFRVTSVVRTLMDLGRFLTVDQLEIAMESACRGSDPRRPDLWNERILDELVARMALCPRGLGIPNMRNTLARRPVGARPTGSFVEPLACKGFGWLASACRCSVSRPCRYSIGNWGLTGDGFPMCSMSAEDWTLSTTRRRACIARGPPPRREA
jgi:hypothetical protein